MGLNDFLRKGEEKPIPKPELEEEATPAEEPQVIHIVQPGESLSKIAKEHYGNAMKWKIIYDANAEKISNPDIIHPGEEFIIPKLEES